MNGYGLLDIVRSGIESGTNKVAIFTTCPDGGAQLHGGCGYFACPAYMDRAILFGPELSHCLECKLDHIQLPGNTGEQCSSFICPLAERPLGRNIYTTCGNGAYSDNLLVRNENHISSLSLPRCVPCEKGSYTDTSLDVIDKWYLCYAGSYASDN